MIGDFLAYQFITDVNYSPLTDFSEMEFVVPGPGARDGIHKCFETLGESSPADVIRIIAETQETAIRTAGPPIPFIMGQTAAAGRLPKSLLRSSEVRAVGTSGCEGAHGTQED